ncbi:related to DNA Polymerase iota (POLI) [Cephalotrichum gorgonifer]|uniref:Related to DNA Polymerase iota (POLI) n=1 Tax=Cephalotrichum gorgonifer TaxID=2041049 RepID=A0AAE8N5F8_9PEZI|nr:related to DNA Polymerase iota (POLI) [Cephalotrichum gorgonifer]
MDRPAAKSPKRKDDRVILQFDYDCFYASVFENQNPALKSVPLGVRQKGILATCNYVARARGVSKLTQISVAKKACPELVIVDGEDLTPFRDVSKKLYRLLKSHSWNGKVERLGLDEVFMDVTDIVDYNIFFLNRASLSTSFFCLSRNDPEQGFPCDLTHFAGCVEGASSDTVDFDSPLCLRLLLGSHLANYLRMKLENDRGFTSTCGIATNKLLSKLAGNRNKPRNQTTLLSLRDEDVTTFVDGHSLRQVPWIGYKTSKLLHSKLLPDLPPQDPMTPECKLTAGDVRTHPEISAASLEVLLGGPGAEKGIGQRVWSLLHGVDDTEVKPANDIPTQISIEDTYRGLDGIGCITDELRKIARSLLRRMRVDLVIDDESPHKEAVRRWVARPKTLRLSVNAPPTDKEEHHSFSRVSRSAPLPNFVFSLKEDVGELADRLVDEAVLPLLRKFQGGRELTWEVSLLNICVANMVLAGSDDASGSGRDISVMFKTQDDVLRPFRVAPPPEKDKGAESGEVEADDDGWDPEWDGFIDGEPCSQCGYRIPYFALAAHLRYHELGDE